MQVFLILSWLCLCPYVSANVHPDSEKNAAIRSNEKLADAILGEWLDEKQTVRIRVYREHEQYHARIVWLKDPSIARPGTPVLAGLRYSQRNSWQQGRIYYPRTGAWYDCRCTLHNTSMMKVRVYIGTPLFGKTLDFRRVDTVPGSARLDS